MSSVEQYLASLSGVHATVKARRDVIASKARANLAPHDRPRGHRIRTTTGRYDAYVWLEGPAPGALEYGHFTPDGGRYVDGLHILGDAT